jgi:hypothetical protein
MAVKKREKTDNKKKAKYAASKLFGERRKKKIKVYAATRVARRPRAASEFLRTLLRRFGVAA